MDIERLMKLDEIDNEILFSSLFVPQLSFKRLEPYFEELDKKGLLIDYSIPNGLSKNNVTAIDCDYYIKFIPTKIVLFTNLIIDCIEERFNKCVTKVILEKTNHILRKNMKKEINRGLDKFNPLITETDEDLVMQFKHVLDCLVFFDKQLVKNIDDIKIKELLKQVMNIYPPDFNIDELSLRYTLFMDKINELIFIKNEGKVREKYSYKNYTFVELLDEDSYIREGKILKHCVSSHFGYRESGTVIYSLRDKANIPLLTIEHSLMHNKINEIKGKNNKHCKEEWVIPVLKFLDFLDINPVDINYDNINDYLTRFIINGKLVRVTRGDRSLVDLTKLIGLKNTFVNKIKHKDSKYLNFNRFGYLNLNEDNKLLEDFFIDLKEFSFKDEVINMIGNDINEIGSRYFIDNVYKRTLKSFLLDKESAIIKKLRMEYQKGNLENVKTKLEEIILCLKKFELIREDEIKDLIYDYLWDYDFYKERLVHNSRLSLIFNITDFYTIKLDYIKNLVREVNYHNSKKKEDEHLYGRSYRFNNSPEQAGELLLKIYNHISDLKKVSENFIWNSFNKSFSVNDNKVVVNSVDEFIDSLELEMIGNQELFLAKDMELLLNLININFFGVETVYDDRILGDVRSIISLVDSLNIQDSKDLYYSLI